MLRLFGLVFRPKVIYFLATPRSWGCVSAINSMGRTIWIADAHRDDGKRFVAEADEKLTAFVELESVVRACGELV